MTTPFVFLFDIDGTLLSSGGAGKLALETALQKQFGIDRIRQQVPYSGRTDVAIGRDLLHAHDIEPTDTRLAQLQEAYLQELPAALVARQGAVLPGVITLLEELKQQEQPVLVGLLTGNIRRGAQVKLGHYGVDHYFAFGGFGDGVLTRNEVAQAAWNAAGTQYHATLSTERCWVIGDTPLDISCARHIGARVLAVTTGYHSSAELQSHQPDLLLEHLDQPFLLQQLMS
ncbi:MAG: HAD family hydrolase [Gemmatales bacterium]